ncbi:MAG: prepilin-type N-terminal cleavage/methylation domain-containing protein [Lachnospiraceae bacterium]|jgi:prepilin-type N-terminal cleavage/methylation domain-containing protein|nr:prepilin-type N-terminal cleavage/methylation domain-containing protein [Lachnospiraceae bacterium]
MLKWRKKNSKGFSLVELIIVIAIMAILGRYSCTAIYSVH